MSGKIYRALLLIFMSWIVGCSDALITALNDDEDRDPCKGNYAWSEYSANPLFGGSTSGVDRAYYPFVVKSGSTYHIWYGDGSGTRHAISTARDFSDIILPAQEITVGSTNISAVYVCAYHPYVLYSESGWTVGGIFYSNPFLLYITPDFNSVRVLHSPDGDDWTEIGLCTGITGAGGYVPQGANVYNFAVLYEGGTTWKAYADNGGGHIQYYTSSNGLDWTGTASDILGAPYQAWEGVQNGIAPCIMKVDGTYIIYYSSGALSNDSAIGMAASMDGQTFTKDDGNPIFSIDDVIAWRDDRTYTPRLIRDGTLWRMYLTGRSSGGVYSVGLATKCGSLD
jgi:hypothetical protein